MKFHLSLAALVLNNTFCLYAQGIRVYNEKVKERFEIYADNPEIYPVSVVFEFTLTNMRFSYNESKVFLLPAKSTRNRIGDITRKHNIGDANFNYKYRKKMGDVMQNSYDVNFLYDLPFKKGNSLIVHQGYNGTYSHTNENALDFTMPEGTEILAAREGLVVEIVQSNFGSCPTIECAKYNNYVTIMHPDGTFGSYLHIKYNGANCKLGDKVSKGDIIAYSGNVGWSSGPHLHFVCFLAAFGKNRSLETKFRTNLGDEAVILQQGQAYSREY